MTISSVVWHHRTLPHTDSINISTILSGIHECVAGRHLSYQAKKAHELASSLVAETVEYSEVSRFLRGSGWAFSCINTVDVDVDVLDCSNLHSSFVASLTPLIDQPSRHASTAAQLEL
jgi:hypothetical protein